MARRSVTPSSLLADAAAASSGSPGITVEEISKKDTPDGVEARSVSQSIRTVDDLLKKIEADLSRFEISASEATSWEGLTADRLTGKPIITTLHRVYVRLRPRGRIGVHDCVEAMISAARMPKAPRKPPAPRRPDAPWAVLVIADPHFGKYSWRKTAGDDYDLDIAARFVRQASEELLGIASSYAPGRMTVATLGDIYHYDTPAGTTTKGTPLERDGRLQKMIAVGTDVMLSVVDAASLVAKTDVLVVSGNHDETLTWALHRIMQERFRGSNRVSVEEGYTPRKYLSHGGNLLGFSHGHKAKKKLPQLMALEAAKAWAACPYREFHTGHLHNQSAEWSRPAETRDGVLVRIAPAVCPPDDFHAVEGYIGSRQAMELFVYCYNGGLSSMHVSGPGFDASR